MLDEKGQPVNAEEHKEEVIVHDDVNKIKELSALLPNKKRGNWAVIMIGMVMFSEVLLFLANMYKFKLLSNFAENGAVSTEQFDVSDAFIGLSALLSLLLFVISIVTFIMWFRRAYYNLHQKVDFLQFDEGWAAGAWFVPILNIIRPFSIMKELYRETESYLKQKDPSVEVKLNENLVVLWWALWILSNSLGRLQQFLSNYIDTVETMINVQIYTMFENIIGLILAVVTIKTVRDYTKVEPKLFE